MMKWYLKTFLNFVLIFVLVGGVLFVNLNILHFSFVPSDSMEPAIKKYSLILGTRYDVKDIKRGDIVTFQKDGIILLKRVIGLPNETIEIENGIIYIDGKKMKDPYMKEKMKLKSFKMIIPNDSIFVMGDNRNHSFDSREFGSVKKKEIMSRIKFILLPLCKGV